MAGYVSKRKLDKIDVFSGDIRDHNGVRQAMQGMDVVFHLAALIAIPFSYHSPDSYVDKQINISMDLITRKRRDLFNVNIHHCRNWYQS